MRREFTIVLKGFMEPAEGAVPIQLNMTELTKRKEANKLILDPVVKLCETGANVYLVSVDMKYKQKATKKARTK